MFNNFLNPQLRVCFEQRSTRWLQLDYRVLVEVSNVDPARPPALGLRLLGDARRLVGPLLGEPAALKCGLPVSRSYLLSKYGLALVAEAPASPEAGRPLTVTVKGCDVKEAVDAYPWFDSYTTNGTRDLGWCDPSALEIWVRASVLRR